MKYRLSIITLCCCFLGVLEFQGFARTASAQSKHAENSAATTAIVKPAASFPAGTFVGDDIFLKLDSQGNYLLSGGAVEQPMRGAWTTETKGKHTLIRLIATNKKDDDWLMGVRTKNTLQVVDEDTLNVLNKPLNITEDAGILTRDK